MTLFQRYHSGWRDETVVAKYFGTTAKYTCEGYAAWTIKDKGGRAWKILRDSSIRAEDDSEQYELVTPILNWGDIETLQEIVWDLRRAYGKVNWSCGQPIAVAAAIHFSAALVAFAKRAKKALYRPINTDNAKFAMRTFLTRPQGLNLNGGDYSMTRHFLTKNLEGNGAWRFAC